MLEKDGSAEKALYKKEFPKDETILSRPKAIIECYKPIPCNPCETSCPVDAIHIGEDINARPVIDFDRCTGCGICATICPGLAITIRKTADEKATMKFPYEFLPRPTKGMTVTLVNRSGDPVGSGRVLGVLDGKRQNKTALVHVEMARTLLYDAISIEVLR